MMKKKKNVNNKIRNSGIYERGGKKMKISLLGKKIKNVVYGSEKAEKRGWGEEKGRNKGGKRRKKKK